MRKRNINNSSCKNNCNCWNNQAKTNNCESNMTNMPNSVCGCGNMMNMPNNGCGCGNMTNMSSNGCGCGNMMNMQNGGCTCGNMMNNRHECTANTMEQLRMDLKACEFTIQELALYLDTHPDDMRAVCMHNEHCKHYRKLADEYQKVYGPLSIMYPCNSWRWLEEPWPWLVLGV